MTTSDKSGVLLVTGDGEVTIDETLQRSRTLLIRPEDVISVMFDPCDPPLPPCADTGDEDACDWEVVIKHKHHDAGTLGRPDELVLKIIWHVTRPRHIIWRIKGF